MRNPKKQNLTKSAHNLINYANHQKAHFNKLCAEINKMCETPKTQHLTSSAHNLINCANSQNADFNN